MRGQGKRNMIAESDTITLDSLLEKVYRDSGHLNRVFDCFYQAESILVGRKSGASLRANHLVGALLEHTVGEFGWRAK
jgi:hypothetical protein